MEGGLLHRQSPGLPDTLQVEGPDSLYKPRWPPAAAGKAAQAVVPRRHVSGSGIQGHGGEGGEGWGRAQAKCCRRDHLGARRRCSGGADAHEATSAAKCLLDLNASPRV